MFINNNTYEGDHEMHRIESLIGHMVKVDGTMKSQGSITIDGEFKGVLEVGNKLTIGKDASVEAQIKAKDAFIAGSVIGDMEVSERLELSASSKINGNIKAGMIVMEAGAILNGNCQMGGGNALFDKNNEKSKLSESKKSTV